MKVPLLDLRALHAPLADEIKAAVAEVVDATQYILGPRVEALEAAIAAVAQVEHGIGVSSGTDALLVGLMALGVGPGDLVLTTPYSFFATAGVIARLGARPAFVDIEPETFNLSPAALAAWFDDHPDLREQVAAVLPVDLFGQCAAMDEILAVTEPRGLPVVEDAAQALGASLPGRSGHRAAGSLGRLACFSFFPSKNLGGIGDGGMVVTNDAALADRIRVLRVHGAKPKYHHALIGGNFRLDAVQAAVLQVKLPHLSAWCGRRRAHARRYDERFAGTAVTAPRRAHPREHHVYNQYVITVPDRRDALVEHLRTHEIGTAVYYPVPFHLQECFAELGYRPGEFPHSEYAAEHTLALPVYPDLTSEMQDFVVEKVLEFYAQ